MSYYDTSDHVDPVTNNIRRIFRERGFKTQKAMALFLGEKPEVFRNYIWVSKRQIPSYSKLKRWAESLNIPVSEFYIIHAIEPWPYRPPREKIKRKSGVSYRRSYLIFCEIITLLPYETIIAHEGLRYLYDMHKDSHYPRVQYEQNSQDNSDKGMAAEDIQFFK